MADGFETATSAVEPTKADKDLAIQAHLDVRETLEKDATLLKWGVDSILIGSYKRQVSIRRIKDVDVFCRLGSIPRSVNGADVLAAVSNALTVAYGSDAVEPQARSVKVKLAAWGGLHVDAVPARPAGAAWEIPKHGDPNSWDLTNPDELTSLSSTMNAEQGDIYVPTVKLLRQTRRTLLGKHPGGLFVEAALYDRCVAGEVQGSNQRIYYVSALRAVANVLDLIVDYGYAIPNPAVADAVYEFRATDAEWSHARERFGDAAARAERALESPRCAAEAVFHSLLGTNSDGDSVYPLPDDCNADGSTKARTIPGDASVTGGNQRFA